MSAQGLILFGHGSRDARWSEPLFAVRDLCAARATAAAPLTIEVAFLEFQEPTLEMAAQRLIEAHCEQIVVIPMFLGQGGHVRNDLPRLIAALQHTAAGRRLRLAPSIGESAAVLEALCDYCIAELQPGTDRAVR
jgi:sirohydrochlorin cobaltochelatase